MARIDSYPNDNNIELSDKLIGTDAQGGIAKNYTMNKIVEFVSSQTFVVDGEEEEFNLGIVNPKYSDLKNGSMVLFSGISPNIAAVKIDNFSWFTFNVTIID